MFKIAEKTELNQISLTGVRAIVLAGLLIVQPRSLDEIRRAFIDLKIMEDENSDDILRIDLNTLKIMGCEISRASAKTDFKYVLGDHPFAFKIKEQELNILKKAYNQLKTNADIVTLLDFDSLLKKLASRVTDIEKKEVLLGISALKHFDVEMIKDLVVDCNQGRTLSLLYKKTSAQDQEEKDVVAQKVVCQNDKVYLYAYDLAKQENVVLHIGRIKSILARKLEKTKVEPTSTTVRFTLETTRLANLQEGEHILDSIGNKYIIEGNYYNEFIAAQRILSFGPKCVVTEPTEFRKMIITKLKEMRESYGD